jgi:flagellar biosynthesis/type III secretory pathway chaperone
MPLNCNDLAAILSAENAALRSFIDVLQGEQRVLLTGKIDELVLFAEPKTKLINELTVLAEQRLQLLRNCGVSPDRAGMEQLLNEHYAGDGQETDAWEQLLHLAAVANQANNSNGLLISARMNYTQRALQTIFTAARLPTAYAPDGSTVGFRNAQQIAITA